MTFIVESMKTNNSKLKPCKINGEINIYTYIYQVKSVTSKSVKSLVKVMTLEVKWNP